MSGWTTCGDRAGRAPAPASRARRATTAARSRACRRNSSPTSASRRFLAPEQQRAGAPRGGGLERREAAASAAGGEAGLWSARSGRSSWAVSSPAPYRPQRSSNYFFYCHSRANLRYATTPPICP
ncbi:hypothetical protein BAE44_0015517 [Dichanthelium oligosanthes]|uniref:Uncharacterized protein n=1 Tax=Dichanthelium oligosanthes TaxID=888268 RepID=A0A1E5VE95_9POAL|nr:hypothetical protein BAE44_0015517 [Dichanthelium oligosanthes]